MPTRAAQQTTTTTTVNNKQMGKGRPLEWIPSWQREQMNVSFEDYSNNNNNNPIRQEMESSLSHPGLITADDRPSLRGKEIRATAQYAQKRRRTNFINFFGNFYDDDDGFDDDFDNFSDNYSQNERTESAYCGCSACKDQGWNTNANGFTCGERIKWVQGQQKSMIAACSLVGGTEFPDVCIGSAPEAIALL